MSNTPYAPIVATYPAHGITSKEQVKALRDQVRQSLAALRRSGVSFHNPDLDLPISLDSSSTRKPISSAGPSVLTALQALPAILTRGAYHHTLAHDGPASDIVLRWHYLVAGVMLGEHLVSYKVALRERPSGLFFYDLNMMT